MVKKRKRIDRNNYDPEAVLEYVKTMGDPDGETVRLLEESAQAYYFLRDVARSLYNSISDASCDLTEWRHGLLWPSDKRRAAK